MKPPGAGDHSTSISSTMLAGVKLRHPEAWKRLTDVWEPVIYGQCRRYGLQPNDAADIAQDVFLRVFQNAHEFQRVSFRAWILTIAHNRIMDFFRDGNKRPTSPGGSSAQGALRELPEPNGARDGSLTIQDLAPDALIVRRVLEAIRGDFEERTFQAFWQTAVEGRSAKDVAEELGMTVAAVRQAKARVLKRLREEMDGML